MKTVIKYFSRLLFAAYIAVSLISLNNCGTKDGEGRISFEKLVSQKAELINYLKEKYDAELFTNSLRDLKPEYLKSIVGTNMVLDTLVIGTREENGKYFLKTRIKSEGKANIFAEFGCEKSVVEKFAHSKSSSALIVAKINSVNISMIPAELDTVNSNSTQMVFLRNALVAGDCISYNEYRDPGSV